MVGVWSPMLANDLSPYGKEKYMFARKEIKPDFAECFLVFMFEVFCCLSIALSLLMIWGK
jgi:hypothetical protein